MTFLVIGEGGVEEGESKLGFPIRRSQVCA